MNRKKLVITTDCLRLFDPPLYTKIMCDSKMRDSTCEV